MAPSSEAAAARACGAALRGNIQVLGDGRAEGTGHGREWPTRVAGRGRRTLSSLMPCGRAAMVGNWGSLRFSCSFVRANLKTPLVLAGAWLGSSEPDPWCAEATSGSWAGESRRKLCPVFARQQLRAELLCARTALSAIRNCGENGFCRAATRLVNLWPAQLSGASVRALQPCQAAAFAAGRRKTVSRNTHQMTRQLGSPGKTVREAACSRCQLLRQLFRIYATLKRPG